MGFRVSEISKFLGGSAKRAGQALLSKGRMSVSGHNILDEFGNPWIGRGYVWGQRELWHAGDGAADAAVGANVVRIMARCWGGGHGGNTYQLPVLDGEGIGNFGDWDINYLAATKQHFLDAKNAGLKTILALDSNCGQNGNQDAPTQGYCALFDGSVWQNGQNYFTALGKAQKLPYHINRGRILLRVLHGLVDFVEPLVEPNPLATGNTILDYCNLVVQCMNAWLVEDPNLIFILGGNAYQNGKTSDPVTQGVTYPTSNIVLTCDFLDNAMTTDDATWATNLANMTSARSSTGFPVFCQQAGTTYNDDNAGTILANRLDSFRTATGGSIGWTFWEKVSQSIGNYGTWYDPTTNATGRTDANGAAARRAVIQNAFNASRINPT